MPDPVAQVVDQAGVAVSRRRGQVGHPTPARRVMQSLKLDAEDDDQHPAEPEDRHGQAEEAEQRHRIVQPGILFNGGDNADGHSQNQGKEQRSGRQDQGEGQALADQVAHFLALRQRNRGAPVAGQQPRPGDVDGPQVDH